MLAPLNKLLLKQQKRDVKIILSMSIRNRMARQSRHNPSIIQTNTRRFARQSCNSYNSGECHLPLFRAVMKVIGSSKLTGQHVWTKVSALTQTYENIVIQIYGVRAKQIYHQPSCLRPLLFHTCNWGAWTKSFKTWCKMEYVALSSCRCY
jgi:hypothetical protein